MVFNIISVVLQYSLMALIYYFLFRVVKLIYSDLKQPLSTSKNVVDKFHSITISKPQLIVLDHGQVEMASNSYDLGETTSIGRSSVNDIIINDNFVSHEHACITYYNNGFWLTDLNSTNSTYRNGERISGEILLTNGDEIKIGAVTFKYGR